MAGSSLSPPFRAMCGLTSAQGDRFSRIEPPEQGDFRVLAFLSKADQDQTSGTWDVLFEVAHEDWMQNVIFARPVGIGGAQMPPVPALVFHVQAVTEAVLLTALGLSTADHLAEGSWYRLTLTPGAAGAVTGQLYDPDIDTV